MAAGDGLKRLLSWPAGLLTLSAAVVNAGVVAELSVVVDRLRNGVATVGLHGAHLHRTPLARPRDTPHGIAVRLSWLTRIPTHYCIAWGKADRAL